MLTVIRSPEPRIPLSSQALSPEASALLGRLFQRPHKCQWIVPTNRRRKALRQEWLQRPAGLLPGLHTLESFVAQALKYGLRQRPRIGEMERRLRLSRAWQEATGHAAGIGLVRRLDHFLRDWQGEGWEPAGSPSDHFEAAFLRYGHDLERDQCLDRLGSVRALTNEVNDPDSGPSRFFLRTLDLILLDGFHLLERVELELIAALSHRCDVLLWLVGAPDGMEWKTLEESTALLQEEGDRVQLPPVFASFPATALADLGRSLLLNREASGGRKPPVEAKNRELTPPARPLLAKLETASPRAEVEAVARHIKEDYRRAQAEGRTMRLSDVAVVIPGPAYDPLIREVFPRAGLEFNLAGRALSVSASRPARVLTAVFQLIRGQWHHERLLDFLNQPLVKRRLENAHRLTYLFEHRPRARQRLGYSSWRNAWKQHLAKLQEKINGWGRGEHPLPEGTNLSREEYVARQNDLRESSAQLLASVEKVLQPVADLEAVLKASPPSPTPLRPLVEACVQLLETLEIDEWLKPFRGQGSGVRSQESGVGFSQSAAQARSDRQDSEAGERLRPPASSLQPPALEQHSALSTQHSGPATRHAPPATLPAVPWVEYEKDQQAYFKLLASLKALAEMPEKCLPQRIGKEVNALALLQMALAGETYQIRTEDDAGVQVFELREIRGLCFRRVYALGLIDGWVPALPEETLPEWRQRQESKRTDRLQAKEWEAVHLFRQLFESVQDRLVLSRPRFVEEQPTLPSRYLLAVEEVASLPQLEVVSRLVSPREAACWVGRGDAETRRRGDAAYLAAAEAALASWPGVGRQESEIGSRKPLLARPSSLAPRPSPLMDLLYPEQRAFSPSELETYAACPFRYFGNYVLKLAERDSERERLHYGSLVHRVFHRFYLEKRREFEVSEDRPLPRLNGQCRQRLLELFEEEWAALDAGVVSPDLRTLFVHEQGVLQLFVEIMDLLEKEHGYGNLLNEFDLKDEQGGVLLGTDAQGRRVYVTGKIDRVDAHRENHARTLIFDYKTGRAVSGNIEIKMDDGRLLQLPLYAAMLCRRRNHLEVVGAAYVHLNEKVGNPKSALTRMGKLALKGDRRPLAPLDIAKAESKALELVGRIRAGDFSLTQHVAGSPHAECTNYCPMRHVCRQPREYRAS